ncbi:hypothetical protein BH10PSE19_BH10PSE19_20260 [soil metagenome]
MQHAYRVPKQQLKPGEYWDPSTGIPIEALKVQSIITTPRALTLVGPGKLTVTGKAFTGTGVIAKVEISTNNGKSWQQATLDTSHPIIKGSWVIFNAEVEVPKSGNNFTILSRATDTVGNVQPMLQPWNPGGYIHNAVDKVMVNIVSEHIIAGRNIMQQRCLICHSKEYIGSQRLTKAEWEKVVTKMQLFGAILTDTDSKTLLEYLETFSPKLEPSIPMLIDYQSELTQYQLTDEVLKANPQLGAQLFATNCAMCHGPSGEGLIGPRLAGRAIGTVHFQKVVLEGLRTMPPFAGRLKPADILNIQRFLVQ